MSASAKGDQKGAVDSLELQAPVCCLLRAVGIKLRSSARTALRTAEPSLQPTFAASVDCVIRDFGGNLCTGSMTFPLSSGGLSLGARILKNSTATKANLIQWLSGFLKKQNLWAQSWRVSELFLKIDSPVEAYTREDRVPV